MRGEKGQVTIFVILALVIIVIGVLIYAFLPRVTTTSDLDIDNPSAYIESCLSEDVDDAVEILALSGGESNPESSYMYLGENIKYLCYTREAYKLCTMQQPLLESSFENELAEEISPEVESCFEALQRDYENQGYSVSLTRGEISTEILPGRVLVNINHELGITRNGETSQEYKSFNIFLNNNIYQLVKVGESIINREATFGDADPVIYMMTYKDIKVEKIRQSDETKIYVLTNKETGEKFQFASRSLAFPPGLPNPPEFE